MVVGISVCACVRARTHARTGLKHTRLTHILFMLIEGRARKGKEKKKKKKALILPNDWSHVVKGKIRLFDTGAERGRERERVEREEKMSDGDREKR